MKVIYTYIFIFLYTWTLVRPIIPIIEYNLNYDYIVKVLCINKDEPELKCNGKCHLAKEIKKSLPIESEDKQPTLPVMDFDKFPITYQHIHQQRLDAFKFSKQTSFFSNEIGKVNNYVVSIFHPPDLFV